MATAAIWAAAAAQGAPSHHPLLCSSGDDVGISGGDSPRRRLPLPCPHLTPPSPPSRLSPCSGGLRSRCQGGDVDAAMALLARMEASGLRPDEPACAALVSALGAVGRTLEADIVFREMKWRSAERRPPEVGSYNALLRGFLRKGQLPMAERLLAEMKGDMVLLLDAFVRAGRLEDTWWAVGEMKKKGFPLDSSVYSKVIRLYRDNGMWKTKGGLLRRRYIKLCS